MKKVIIIGATGSLPQYVIAETKGLENVALTLFVRNKNRLSKNIANNCGVLLGMEFL